MTKNNSDIFVSLTEWLTFLAMLYRFVVLGLAGIVGIWCALACLVYFGYVMDDIGAGIATAGACMFAGYLMFKEALS